MSLNRNTLIQSVLCQIQDSKLTGKLNLQKAAVFDLLVKTQEFITNNPDYASQIYNLHNVIDTYKYSESGSGITTIKSEAPISYLVNGDPINATAPVVTSFTTTDIVKTTLFGSGTLIDHYQLNEGDFLSNYTDSNSGRFSYIIITSLDNIFLKYKETNTSGYSYTNVPITIRTEDLSQWSLYATSTSDYSHDIGFKLVDSVSGKHSNIATLTVNRVSESINLPATIGDIAITADNREVVTLTLAMFTTQLSPPYNDPESDLIDAIRLDEISTANQGVFKLSGVDVIQGQVITREAIDAGLFTYEAANVNDLYGDAFSFSARDEGSQIWVQ